MIHDNRPPWWRTDAGIFAVGLVLLSLYLIPFWSVDLLPLQDYPNHLARAHILVNANNEVLRRFYEASWHLIPNLAGDVFVTAVAPLIGVGTGMKLFVSLAVAGLVLGVLAVQRVLFGSLSIAALFAVLLIFNLALIKGFLNFTFGTGLALLLFALWQLLRNADWRTRLALFAVLTSALLLAHAYALGFYAVTVLAFEGASAWQQRHRVDKYLLGEVGVALGQFLLPTAIFLSTSTGQALFEGIQFRPLGEKLEVGKYLVASYDDRMTWVSLTVLSVPVLLAIARDGKRLDGRVETAVIVLLFVYLGMPFTLGTSDNADWRILPQIALLLIAGIHVHSPRTSLRVGLLVLLLGATGVQIWTVHGIWRKADDLYAQVTATLREVPRGSRVYTVAASPSYWREIFPIPVLHLGCAAVWERDAFVPSLFAGETQQPLRYRPEYHDTVRLVGSTWHPGGAGVDWNHVASSYDYVLAFDLKGKGAEPSWDMGGRLAPSRKGTRFTLYRVVREPLRTQSDRKQPAVPLRQKQNLW